MKLPKDNYILLSFINTKLRDEYSSLQEFCDENECSLKDICGAMDEIGYKYDPDKNAFVRG
jgi:hypothetical protein